MPTECGPHSRRAEHGPLPGGLAGERVHTKELQGSEVPKSDVPEPLKTPWKRRKDAKMGERWGKMGGKWGEMRGNGGKWGEMGGKGGGWGIATPSL